MKIELQDFVEAFARELEIDPANIQADTKLDDIPEWDSLGMVRFLLACDEKFEVELPAAEASQATTIADLKQKVEGAAN